MDKYRMDMMNAIQKLMDLGLSVSPIFAPVMIFKRKDLPQAAFVLTRVALVGFEGIVIMPVVTGLN